MKQNILTESIRYENKYGNWWYEHDICIEDYCNVLINSCDNSYSAGRQRHPHGPKRIVRCRDHFKEDMKERHLSSNPKTNKVSQIAYGIAGGKEKFYEKSRDERFLIRKEATKIYLLNEKPAEEYFNWADSQKESVIRLVTSPVKSRDKSQYDKLKELYNYTCQVEGCYETEVEFAHILKHSLPNSVDNPTNGWCLCRNHHKAYDSNRMIVELNGDFIRYDVHGNIIEPHGRIIYNDLHNVNSMFITLAREWHDRKK